MNEKVPRTTGRKKRVAVIVVIATLALITAISLAVANRIDLEIQKSRITMLEENQELLLKTARENRDSLNIIIENQESIFMFTNNLTNKLNELITDYNCEKMKSQTYRTFVNTWLTHVPNAFIRALNGALTGKLTVDLLPGDDLKRVVKYYTEFSGTIFMNNPSLLYETASVKIVKLSKNPPMIECLVSVPRVLYPQFGKVYHLKSCHWNDFGKNMSLMNPHQGIMSYQHKTWWDPKTCVTSSNVLLCDKRELQPIKDDCLDFINDKNITRCSLQVSKNIPTPDLFSTPYGVLVCQKETVTLLSRDVFGVQHTRQEKISTPTYYTVKDGGSLLIGQSSYQLDQYATPITVKIGKFEHIHLQSNESIKSLDIPLEINHITKLDEIPNLRYHQYVSYGGLITVFVILGLGVCILIYKYKSQKEKRNKQVGFLFKRIATRPPVDYPDINTQDSIEKDIIGTSASQ